MSVWYNDYDNSYDVNDQHAEYEFLYLSNGRFSTHRPGVGSGAVVAGVASFPHGADPAKLHVFCIWIVVMCVCESAGRVGPGIDTGTVEKQILGTSACARPCPCRADDSKNAQ